MAEICQNCHELPATVHLCEYIGRQQTVLNLCEACFRSRSSNHNLEFPLLDGTQVCDYCHTIAQCCGLNQPWEIDVRKQKFHFTCFRCSELEREFMAQALDLIPKNLSPDQQMVAIQRVIAETDRLVRVKVQETKF